MLKGNGEFEAKKNYKFLMDILGYKAIKFKLPMKNFIEQYVADRIMNLSTPFIKTYICLFTKRGCSQLRGF